MRVKVVFWAVAVLGILSVVYSLESLSGNDIQALKYYQAHAYRHSVDILSVKTNLSVLEKYVLARSLQELKRDDDALELFRSMNLDEISKSKYGSFLLENTVYYFSRLLADKGGGTNGDQLDLSLKEIRPLMNALPTKSIYYPDLLKSLLALEWKKGDYQSITNIGYQASFVSNYQELALFALGDYGRLSNIAQTFPDAAIILLKDLTNNIDPQSITNISVSGLSRLFLFYLNQGQYGPASQFLEAAIEKNPDEDFAFRNRFLYEYRRGNRQAAMEALAGRIENGNTSLKTINLYVGLLRSERRYESLYGFFKKRALLQSSQYDSEIIETMSRMERWDELAKWYQGRTNDSALSEDDTRDIIRSLIVKRPELAKGILEALPENRRSGYTWYLAALIDLENNNPDEAYSKLLKTVLNYPFTYEWVIAKELELELRTNREAQFKEAVQAKMAYLPGYSLKKRFYLSLGLKETAPEFYKDNLQQMKESYEESLDRQGIQAELPLSQEIKSILKSKSNELIYLGPELLNTLVRLCGDDPDLYSANLDLFEKIGQAGYATHKLNHLVSRDLGGRQYLPLLSKKLQKALYPDEYFDRVVSNCGNTNDALWYLSAFREESHFKTDSLSRSGAVGLAQLMPKTAEAVMRNMKKPDWNVYDSEDNLLIGLAHFKSLFRKYKGNAAHALAAYNAGESVVNHWIRTNKHDIPLWTEMIDYEETRDYVRKIVLTRYFYQYIYKIKNP